MDKMLIGSNQITGNVGSCKTEITTGISSRPSLFYENTITYATNSCTGQVETFPSWQLTGSCVGIILAVVLFFCFVFVVIDAFIKSW
jgi:hypothetical protein